MAVVPAAGAVRGLAQPGVIPQPQPGGIAPTVNATTAKAIDAKLAGSPMAGMGMAFAEAGWRYGVDPWFLATSAKWESDFGRRGFAKNGRPSGCPSAGVMPYNPFGYLVTGERCSGAIFTSWQQGINAAAANLAGPLYRGAGLRTIGQVYGRWSTAKDEEAVASLYGSLSGRGGSVSTVVVGTGNNQLLGRGSPSGILDPVGEGIKDAAGAVTDPLGGLISLVAKLFDPSLWLRVLAVLGGGAILILALVVIFRQSVSSAIIPKGIARGLTPKSSAGG